MAEPVTPSPAPRRLWRQQFYPWLWLLIPLLLAVVAALAGYYGYESGKRYAKLDWWDPLWARAYDDRPLDRSAPRAGFWIAGYYVDYDRGSLDMTRRAVGNMDQVVIFGYGFDRQGNLIGQDQTLIRGITSPQKRVLLFGNLTNGNFDKDTAHAILTDAQVQDRAVANILRVAEGLGVAGVQIDFENILDGDRDAYTEFLRRLKAELQTRQMTLSIAAAAKTRDSRTGWGGATDYEAIGQIVDHFYIMAYDQHWRGGTPGPVAGLDWVERVVRYAVGVMPSQKIVLGVPFYGYEWTAESGKGTSTNRAYGSRRMAERAREFGATITWDPVVAENKATFRTTEGERIAWWPDERSLDAKLRLAYQYNLKGIAIWRVGFEPYEWWEPLGSFRLNPQK